MKTRKLTAILLALCMLLSLSISAFAADDAIASGSPGNNPRVATKEEIIELYYKAL